MGTFIIEGSPCDFVLKEVLPTGFHLIGVYYKEVVNFYIVDPVYGFRIVVQIKNKDKGSKWLHTLLIENKIIRVEERAPKIWERIFLKMKKSIKKEFFSGKLW